jgi:hypothetical protein
MMTILICMTASAWLAMTSASQLGQVIDLTHPVNEHTIAWPTATSFSTEQVKDIVLYGIVGGSPC